MLCRVIRAHQSAVHTMWSLPVFLVHVSFRRLSPSAQFCSARENSVFHQRLTTSMTSLFKTSGRALGMTVHFSAAWGVAVFMTADHARVLRNCSAIFIDGTFRRLCLHHIHITMQLVTVHGLWMTAVIPLCFCLATGKTVGHYRQILVAVRNSIRMYTGHRWQQPDLVICDFEISLINAVETELPNARIKCCSCCYFHFTQSVWRKFSGTGLVSAYRSHSRNGRRLRACVFKIMSLGSLPLPLVRHAFTT